MAPIKNLTIKIGSEDKQISITRLAEVLSEIQSTIFFIGDYLQNKKVRASGDFPDSIRATCGLQIVNVKNGSVQVEIQLVEQPQSTLAAGLGENALSVFTEMTEQIRAKQYVKKMKELIPDDSSRRHIFKHFQNVMPSNQNDYVSIYSGSKELQNLKLDNRKIIDEIIPQFTQPKSKQVIGGSWS